MRLVGQYDSPYVRRVAIAMHLLGVRFERSPLSVFGDADALRRINPLGRVPALVLDDGEALIDSAAILDHLDERVGPERALLPAQGPARRQALRLVAMASGTIDKIGAIVYERMLRPPHMVYRPWIERCRAQAATGLAALEAATGDDWYIGDRPTHPDVIVACMVGYARLRAPEVFSEGAYPRLAARVAVAESLDAFRACVPSSDETMPEPPT